MNARTQHLFRPAQPERDAFRRLRVVAQVLIWRSRAPVWYNPLVGVFIGAVAIAIRHGLVGHQYKFAFLLFFPFVTVASVIGGPTMGGIIIAMTAFYVRWFLDLNDLPPPLLDIFAYAVVAGVIVALGELLARVVVFSETERKRTLAAEGLWASLVRSSHDAIIARSIDGIITSWNPAATRLFGYEAYEAIGCSIGILIPPDRADEEAEISEKIRLGELIEQYETRRLTKSGALLDVSLTVSPIFDKDGGMVGVSKFMRDITRAKQFTDALRASEDRLRCALEAARAGAWRWSFGTEVVDWNPRMYEIFGLDFRLNEASYKMWIGSVLAEDREATGQIFANALNSREGNYITNYRITTPDGEIRWLESFGLIERGAEGEPRRVTGFTLDATERHHALDALKELNVNLKRANESLKKFSSIAAHDLQEPLRKIQQFSDLMVTEYADRLDGDGRFYLEVMHDSARRMRALINALLSFSRAGDRPLTMAAIDTNAMMENVLASCALAIEESGACIEVSRLPRLYGDATLVEQLMQNLISNAVKYARPGEPPHIQVSGEDAGQSTTLRFQDAGIGIASEHLQMIFEPFTRLNPREAVKGTGIGLAFCRTVCERHGWTLSVVSQPGEGSVFSILTQAQNAEMAA